LCKEHNIAVELNGRGCLAQIDPSWIQEANDMRLLFVCGADAHIPQELSEVNTMLQLAEKFTIPKQRILNYWSKLELLDWCKDR